MNPVSPRAKFFSQKEEISKKLVAMNRQIVSSLRVVRIQEDYEFTIYSVPSREEETGTS
jgi:hypothetical protein